MSIKTVVEFLRERLGFKGFFVAFDEGTRTMSFRRGTVKRRAGHREHADDDQSEQ
jgi:hypothetical protein